MDDGRRGYVALPFAHAIRGAKRATRYQVDFYENERNKRNTISLYHFVDYRVCSDLAGYAVFIYYFRDMRTIKFRVWWANEDGVGGQMIANPHIEFKHLNDVFEKMDVWNFMQYTGLKDKNGKEIYEGDIVKEEQYMSNDLISEVRFYEGRFDSLVRVKEGYNCIDQYSPESFEVIGNIHEHSHLLEVKKQP